MPNRPRPDDLLRLALGALLRHAGLSGIILSEERASLFAPLLREARAYWGRNRVAVVPHSAEPAPPPKAARCLLLPNAHLHAPSLLQPLLCRDEPIPFVAFFDPREGTPHPLLTERAFAMIRDVDREPAPGFLAAEPVPRADLPLVGPDALSLAVEAAGARRLTGHRAEYFALQFARCMAARDGIAGELPEEYVERAVGPVMDWRASLREGRPVEKSPAAPASDGGESAHPRGEPGGSGRNPAPAVPRGPDGLDLDGERAGRASAERFRVTPPEPATLPPGWSYATHPTRTHSHNPGSHARWRGAAGRRIGRPASRPGPGGPARAVQTKRDGALIDWHASLLSAFPWMKKRTRHGLPPLLPDDLRYRTGLNRPGLLYIAVLDTSASMLKHRMAKAKGLVCALAEALDSGSLTALVACGGERASIAVWPTRSRLKLERAVAELKSGGQTPLSSGLYQALRLARRFDPEGAGRVRVLLVTDGGANWVAPGENAPLGKGSDKEKVRAALIARSAELKRRRAELLMVDTRGPYAAGGRGRELASMLGADYVPLNALDAPQ